MAKLTFQTGMAQQQQAHGGPGQKKTYPPIPSGNYNAVVQSVTYRPTDKSKADWKTWDNEFVFRFQITDGEYARRVFFYDAKPELNDRSDCRLRLTLESILAVNALPDTFELDLDELHIFEGRPCRIRVAKYTKQNGEDGNKITDILPPLPNAGSIDNVGFTPPPAVNPQPVAPQAPVYDDIPF